MTNASRTAEVNASPRTGFLAAGLCFVVILLDGYDTGVVSYTAPMLARDWNLAPAAFTPAFVATSLGAVIGYVSCGAFGRAASGTRRVVIASVGLLRHHVPGHAAGHRHRDVDGTAVRHGAWPRWRHPDGDRPRRRPMPGFAERRERTTTIVTVAIVIGMTIGGYISVPMLRQWGWQGPYVLGGVLPLLTVPVLIAWLPDAPVRGGAGSPSVLFSSGLAVPTVLLWAMALLSFMQSYSFTYWLPLLLTSFGFDRASAALGNTYIGAGAIGGVALMALFVPRVGSACYLAIAVHERCRVRHVVRPGTTAQRRHPAISAGMRRLALGAPGHRRGVGQAAIAATIYPASLRTTGVGWSSAMGRIGSIVGPGIAGFFLHLQWPARDIIAIAAVPAIGAAAAALGIFLHTRRTNSTETLA